MTEDVDWGRGARDTLGDEGASGLYFARKVLQERIDELEPGDELLAEYIGAIDALELVLSAIGKLEPGWD
jgi:hypothetical protein